MPLLLRLLFVAVTIAHAAEFFVTENDVNVALRQLHPEWPPFSTPPPSDITGLTDDDCNGTEDCVPPRVCFNCPNPPCFCAKPPPHPNITCSSSRDCDEGEFCLWDLLVGITSGTCLSSHYFHTLNETMPVLHEPIQFDEEVPAHSFGLTGDRCFAHDDCQGTRSCLSEKNFETLLHNITTCEASRLACTCTPLSYTQCQSRSGCRSANEICASVLFNASETFSFTDTQVNHTLRLSPLCISSNLTNHRNVFPLSDTASIPFNVSRIPLAQIRSATPMPSQLPVAPQRISPETAPFSVPPLSVFNTFSTNDLANEFIGGILSLIIVSQLHKILQAVVYYGSGIHHRGYSSYLIFSRLTSFRHVARLFTAREPFGTSSEPTPPPSLCSLNFKMIVLPFVAFLFLLAAEVSTIMAGTDSRQEFYATHNFDPVIGVANATSAPRFSGISNEYCDDFFVTSRGMFEVGKVLKCVKPSTSKPRSKVHSALRVKVLYGSGTTIFEVYSKNGSFSAVELSTCVLSKSGQNMKTMPFRPDLMNDQQLMTLLNGVLNKISTRLGYPEVDTRRKLWYVFQYKGPNGQIHSIELGHRPNWSEPVEEITQAVIGGLRDMDLVLNSSGEPWVYTGPYTFEQRQPLMAIKKQYRISHGWLLLAAIVITVIHVMVNSWVTPFDDVAYVAMKELMGEDCVLGPLADSGLRGNTVEILD